MSADNQPSCRTCPVCGQGALLAKRVQQTIDYDADGTSMRVVVEDVPVEECTNCGERLSGPTAARMVHDTLCRALELLPPDEIRALREGYGLSQAEFARLTGIAEATLSRWERGRLMQDRAMDNYLRLLAENPGHVERLRSRLQKKERLLSVEA